MFGHPRKDLRPGIAGRLLIFALTGGGFLTQEEGTEIPGSYLV